VIQNGLIYGAVLSVLLAALFLTAAYLNPEIMLRSYPPDIKAKYGPDSERAKRQRKPMALALFVILVGVLIFSIVQLSKASSGPLTFTAVFLSVCVTLLTFNVVDLVILDWLIFVTLQPRFVVLPGTEGMAGYKDYDFHFKAFLRGTVLCLIASLVIAGITAGIYAVVLAHDGPRERLWITHCSPKT